MSNRTVKPILMPDVDPATIEAGLPTFEMVDPRKLLV